MVRRYILLLATHRPLQRIGCPSAEYIGPIPAQILCDPHCQKKIGARQSSPPTAHPLLALITLASTKKTNPQSLSASSAQAPAAATSHRGLEVAPPAAKRYPIIFSAEIIWGFKILFAVTLFFKFQNLNCSNHITQKY